MSARTPIPARRQRHFPLNGGPRLPASARRTGRSGIAAARAALAARQAELPVDATPADPLTDEQRRRAQRGLAKARAALNGRPADDPEAPAADAGAHAA